MIIMKCYDVAPAARLRSQLRFPANDCSFVTRCLTKHHLSETAVCGNCGNIIFRFFGPKRRITIPFHSTRTNCLEKGKGESLHFAFKLTVISAIVAAVREYNSVGSSLVELAT